MLQENNFKSFKVTKAIPIKRFDLLFRLILPWYEKKQITKNKVILRIQNYEEKQNKQLKL